MARTVADARLETRAARARLAAGAKHWRAVETGLALGYRRGPRGGSWLARRNADGRYLETVLGTSDDATDADGHSVLAFRDAVEAARRWWQDAERAAAGLGSIADAAKPFTIAEALDAYFADRERRGSKSAKSDRTTALARVVPTLGGIEVRKLTTKRIRDWHLDLAAAPKLVRTKRLATKRATKAHDADDADAVRKRRATANRQLTILKAALNLAFREGRAASDAAWRRVRPFREVDVPVVRFLTLAEVTCLLNACQPESFRDLVRGALATGCRYGELARLAASDFHPDSGTVTVRVSKAGNARRCILTAEGVDLFSRLTAGRAARDLIFTRDGLPWGPSNQLRPMTEASARAKLDPPCRFHDLRHVHASLLAQRGVPLAYIGQQLGHADLRITSRNYAHLSPDATAAARTATPANAIR